MNSGMSKALKKKRLGSNMISSKSHFSLPCLHVFILQCETYNSAISTMLPEQPGKLLVAVPFSESDTSCGSSRHLLFIEKTVKQS